MFDREMHFLVLVSMQKANSRHGLSLFYCRHNHNLMAFSSKHLKTWCLKNYKSIYIVIFLFQSNVYIFSKWTVAVLQDHQM